MTAEPTPPKYAMLAALADEFEVPAMTLLDGAALSRLFANFEDVLGRLDTIVERIVQTLGAFVERDIEEFEAVLGSLRPARDAGRQLGELLETRFGPDWERMALAVRSAALAEDLDSRAFAGIYRSELDRRGADAVLESIRAVWCSGYGRTAILHRLAGGQLCAGNPVSVIVQAFVAADHAGVAFSVDPVSGRPDCVVESVAGVGDALVSGRRPGERKIFRSDAGKERRAEDARHPLWPVAQLCRAVEARLGRPVDVEWALVGGAPKLLQARAITTLEATASSAEPLLRWGQLYGEELGPSFAELPEFARYFRAKRKRIADFARLRGLGRPTALLVRANAVGLADTALAEAFAAQFRSDEVVVDLSTHLRQMIFARDELARRLDSLMPDPHCIHVFVVRDFVRGKVGLISQPLAAAHDGVVLEWSEEGLLSINRGIGNTAHAYVDKTGSTGILPPLPTRLVDRLRDETLVAQDAIGPVRIEWVASGHELYPIDFSTIGANGYPLGEDDVVSHGFAEAGVFVLRQDDYLQALSVAASVSLNSIPDAQAMGGGIRMVLEGLAAHPRPPIIVTDRPYAALAALIPHAAGFVFERASILCHLSILLRESGLPSVQSPRFFQSALSATRLRLDTRSRDVAVTISG